MQQEQRRASQPIVRPGTIFGIESGTNIMYTEKDELEQYSTALTGGIWRVKRKYQDPAEPALAPMIDFFSDLESRRLEEIPEQSMLVATLTRNGQVSLSAAADPADILTMVTAVLDFVTQATGMSPAETADMMKEIFRQVMHARGLHVRPREWM